MGIFIIVNSFIQAFLLGGIYVRESITLRSVSNISQKHPIWESSLLSRNSVFLIVAFSHLVDRMADILVHQLGIKPKDVIFGGSAKHSGHLDSYLCH